MTVPRTRKELASFISDRLTTNREAQEKTGKYRVHRLKVFWLEVNHEHHPSAAFSTGWTTTDRDFHVFAAMFPRRIARSGWTLAVPGYGTRSASHAASKWSGTLRTQMLTFAGIDRVWLTEQFMEHVKKVHSYQGRGFGIFFRDSLAESPVPYERPRFSAKFWLGPSIPDRHKAFLDSAEETFSRSSLRLGRPSEDPD